MQVNDVSVEELRRDLGDYLRRVDRGERVIVLDRGRPVAELRPPSVGAELDRLILAGVSLRLFALVALNRSS
jgi:prevent-host-death family protein